VVLLKLGWGHFSTVWLVHDRHQDGIGALKIQKSATHYTEAARDEIRLLSQIRDGDVQDKRCCCRLLDTFDHSGPHGRHVCMVFEVLGDNLLSLIKRYKYRGIPIPTVRNVARQVLIGLDYLHRCDRPAFKTVVFFILRIFVLNGVKSGCNALIVLLPGETAS
jgi:serine/threonine-protein kinase SRPK3